MKSTVFGEKAPKPIGSYNQAVRAGKFLFVSEQLPIGESFLLEPLSAQN